MNGHTVRIKDSVWVACKQKAVESDDTVSRIIHEMLKNQLNMGVSKRFGSMALPSVNVNKRENGKPSYVKPAELAPRLMDDDDTPLVKESRIPDPRLTDGTVLTPQQRKNLENGDFLDYDPDWQSKVEESPE